MTVVALYADGGSIIFAPLDHGVPLPPMRAESISVFHIVGGGSKHALPLVSFPT